MRIARRPRKSPQMELTPMIDCVFQLLIFFMLSSSFQTPMIQLTLPRAATQDQEPPPEILVTVDEQGRFYLNRLEIAAEELEPRLRPLVSESKHRIVTFRGDRKMPYECFVRALDAARAAGAVHLDIAHQPAQ
ncbi:MAG: biopolymer transporter ExbD [Planctomycetia bacterium]|nr:biopolymer transporter ExbD [Planctomycetia bacterium]